MLIPSGFGNFMLGSAIASSVLVGLLFVAVLLGPERVFGRSAPREHKISGRVAFVALSNAFFVSLGALIPGLSIVPVLIIFGGFAFLATVSQGMGYWRGLLRSPSVSFGVGLTLVGLGCYGAELWLAGLILYSATAVNAFYSLPYLVMAMYALAFASMWGLMEAARSDEASERVPLDDERARIRFRSEAGSDLPEYVSSSREEVESGHQEDH